VTDSIPLADLLLTTKLCVPSLTTTLVPRPRLVARLNEGLEGVNGKLTVVTAPAGWGKSTLLSAWCSDIARRGPTDGWPRGPGVVTLRPALQRVRGSGWQGGFGNMLRKELGDWFGTRRWLVQSILWVAIINGFIAFIFWVVPLL